MISQNYCMLFFNLTDHFYVTFLSFLSLSITAVEISQHLPDPEWWRGGGVSICVCVVTRVNITSLEHNQDTKHNKQRNTEHYKLSLQDCKARARPGHCGQPA